MEFTTEEILYELEHGSPPRDEHTPSPEQIEAAQAEFNQPSTSAPRPNDYPCSGPAAAENPTLDPDWYANQPPFCGQPPPYEDSQSTDQKHLVQQEDAEADDAFEFITQPDPEPTDSVMSDASRSPDVIDLTALTALDDDIFAQVPAAVVDYTPLQNYIYDVIVPLLRNVDIEKKDCDKWEELRCPPGSNVPSLVEITALKLFVKCIVKDGLYFNDMFAYGIRPAESPKVLNHDGYDGEQQLLLFWSRLDDLQLRLDIPLSFDELFEQYEMTYRLSDIFAFHEQENQSKKKIEQEKPSLSLPATIAPNDQPKLEDVNPNSTTLTTSPLYQDALTMAHTLLLTDQTSRSGESGTIDTYYDNTEQDATAWGAESSVAEQSGSGVPIVPNVEPDLSWDPSEQETQPLTPSDMSSNDDLKAGSKRKSYYDLPKVGTPKNAKISYVKLVTPSSSTCRTSTSSDLAKQSSKMTYVQYLKECNVKNEKHYDHLIKTDPILAELELSTNVNSLKALKAIVFNQNTTEKPTLMADTLMTEPEPTEKEIRVFDRFFHALFTEIANNNNTDIMTFTKNLFHVLDLSDPKVSTIIFIGKANTGKTYLSNILRSYVPEYDLGIVQSVHGNPSDFWLDRGLS